MQPEEIKQAIDEVIDKKLTATELVALLKTDPSTSIWQSMASNITEDTTPTTTNTQIFSTHSRISFASVRAQVPGVDPMSSKTCKFFAPAKGSAEEHHAEPDDSWPYNQLRGFHACTNPMMNARGMTACEHVDSQTNCAVYQASDGCTLQKVRLTRKPQLTQAGDIREVTLVRTRHGYGTPVFQVLARDTNDEGEFSDGDDGITVLHTVLATQHGNATQEVAQQLFSLSLEEFGTAERQEIPIEQPQSPSYLSSLLVG